MARGTILIADDDTAIRTVLNQALARAGYAPRLPDGFDQLCCGQMMASKGMAQDGYIPCI